MSAAVAATSPDTLTPAGDPALTAVELAELVATFNDVAGKLQGTHETLRLQVARLESELREAHAQLKRARELASLGEMAAGIAHEVRNPLGSIRLYASMLVQDLPDRPGEQAVAEKIARAVERLDAVVGDVLAFSRELRIRAEAVSASKLLAEGVSTCGDLWSRYGIRVVGPRTPRDTTLWCDPVLMHQALVNVLRNAAEAIGEDARSNTPRALWLDAGRRRVLCADGRREWMNVLSIRDSGPGVPADVLARVFNPFFTTRHSGTGLGLAIVHRILDAHGGRVHITNNTSESPEGAPAWGATVELMLPGRTAGVENDHREAA